LKSGEFVTVMQITDMLVAASQDCCGFGTGQHRRQARENFVQKLIVHAR
jgi:hypothetical protein